MNFTAAPRFHVDNTIWRRIEPRNTVPLQIQGRTALPLRDETPVADYCSSVAVWILPEHLHERTWEWLEANWESPGDASALTGEILDFLHFKQMPLPVRIESSLRVRVAEADSSWGFCKALANLGDGPSTVELESPEEPGTNGRITLLPREGLWLPDRYRWRSLAVPPTEPEVLFVVETAR